MNAHTPGPWSYSRTERFGDTRFSIAQTKGAPYTPNYSDVACLVCLETVPDEYIAIQEANARLIAAAPELLSALREARQHVAAWPQCRDNILVDIDAAIAKATGEQP